MYKYPGMNRDCIPPSHTKEAAKVLPGRTHVRKIMFNEAKSLFIHNDDIHFIIKLFLFHIIFQTLVQRKRKRILKSDKWREAL